MTTARSPIRKLKAQARRIAAELKSAEQGKAAVPDPSGKIAAACERDIISFAVVMDDKTLKIEMPWAIIRETSRAGIAEFILNQMREARYTIQ